MPRPDIFGVNLAGLLDEAFQDAEGSFPAVLIKRGGVAPDPDDLTGSAVAADVRHDCRGFLDVKTIRTADGRGVTTGEAFVIFGASLPSADIVPVPGDMIESPTEKRRFMIAAGGVERDPAGATYICIVTDTNVPVT